MTLSTLGPEAWIALTLGAVVVGAAKTAIGNLGSIAVALFALALPTRESTGALLPLLICGDLLAIRLYARHAHWPTLRRLLPGVVPGLLLGAWFLSVVDEEVLRPGIGITLIAMTAVGFWTLRRRRAATDDLPPPRLLITGPMGVAAGFATMTANAAGPVTAVYLMMAGLPMLELLGTGAWFYLCVNVAKLPLSAGLHLVSPASLLVDLTLVPALLLGAWAGARLIKRIEQRQFEIAVLSLGAVAGVVLIV